MREMGETVMYTHTKVDNEGAQKLFEKCGYSEPDWAKKGLTQAQIAQRSTEWNPFAAVGLVEVGHFMLEKPLAPWTFLLASASFINTNTMLESKIYVCYRFVFFFFFLSSLSSLSVSQE